MTAVSLAANLRGLSRGEFAMRRFMILNGVGRFAQFTRMAFVMVDLNKARDGKEILASLGSA
jgi:hypothetical protein